MYFDPFSFSRSRMILDVSLGDKPSILRISANCFGLMF